ncbi:TspO/MBR family protein [Nocardiopsis sp. CNT312]|uniref:TspO/MBR family protein n=1 Tax=Nocardiopsis sp. CNT312 TaxID=1137268 RepID=UPI00048D70F6|nr:TspO/MBR family protein [Nocardiopsis sp. CNT312]
MSTSGSDDTAGPLTPASLAALAVFALAVTAAALIGALGAADTADRYTELSLPSWAPPSWVFGPVWTVLYALMAVSGWLVWLRRQTPGAVVALALFAVQLLLNAVWTPLFFAAEQRGLAFVDIVALLTVLTVTLVLFFRISRFAGALLLPYWAWTAFALVLNLAVWSLNTAG